MVAIAPLAPHATPGLHSVLVAAPLRPTLIPAAASFVASVSSIEQDTALLGITYRPVSRAWQDSATA